MKFLSETLEESQDWEHKSEAVINGYILLQIKYFNCMLCDITKYDRHDELWDNL
jgi:hypothetical protein